jgi:hypothetical protein
MLEAYRRAFEDDLGKLHTVALETEALYATWMQGDLKGHETAIRSIRDSAYSTNRTLIALNLRLHGFMSEAHSLQTGWNLDVVEGLVKEKIFTAGEIAFTLGLFYDVGFGLVGISAFRNYWIRRHGK